MAVSNRVRFVIGCGLILLALAVVFASVISRVDLPNTPGISSIPSTTEGAPATTASPAPPQDDPVAQSMPQKLTVQPLGGGPALLESQAIDQRVVMMERTGPDAGYITKPFNQHLPGVIDDPEYVPWSTLPGTGVGTTVIVGHAIEDTDGVFNSLTTLDKDSALTVGYEAILVTETGVLTYRLKNIERVAKDKLIEDEKGLLYNEPGRLLLIGCDLQWHSESDSEDTFDNVVWEFELVTSVQTD